MSNRRRTKIRMSATYADLYRRSKVPLYCRNRVPFERHLPAVSAILALRRG